MSLALEMGSRPDGLTAVALHQAVKISLSGNQLVEISMADLCELVVFALTATDLVAGDPRLNLMLQLAKLSTIPGKRPGHYRLGVVPSPGYVG